MDDSPTLPSSSLKAYAAVAKAALWLLLAAWFVLAVAWGALHAFIVPRIGEMRPELEAQATRALGVPVRIGSIHARSEGFIPSFELQQVVLLDPAGRPALQLPLVIAALSPRSLWNFGFEQLYIDGPELDIRRAKDGRIFVAGLDFSRASDNDGRGADWFFSQPEFLIRGGTVRWTDEMRDAPPLALRQVDFVARNGGRRHGLRLDATPPREWGERFTLQALFREPLLGGGNGRWQDWEGQAHGDFARVDVSQLRRYANLGVEVTEGHGAVRVWVDLSRGKFAGGAADIRLAGVSTQLGPKLAPLALASVSGRVAGKRLEGGFEFQTQALQFETSEGVRWTGGNVFVRWEEGGGARPAQGELKADQLDLDTLGQVATRLPLGTATHKALAEFAPRGLIESIEARWQGSVDALQKYSAKGRARRIEVASRPALAASGADPGHRSTPGIRGAALDFDFTQEGGRAKVQVKAGSVDLPGVFEDPLIHVDDLAADVQWNIDGPAMSASVTGLRFANADAQGEGSIQWKTGPGAQRFPGVLDLQATLGRADGGRVWRYLPLGVAKPARDYVRESVVQGQVGGARFRVRGDLSHFPFRDPKHGEFRVTADVKNVTFAYVPPSVTRGGPAWPALTQMGAQLVFERNGMQVVGGTGRFVGVPGLQFKADAQIPDFAHAAVGVTSEIKGPLGDALGVVNGSPLSAMLSQVLAKATGTGSAEVRLKLDLPVATLDKSKVQGSVQLAGNDVQITPDTPVLSRARGNVTFNERGFWVAGVQARSLGGDVRIEGGTRALGPGGSRNDLSVLLRAQGTATAEGLRQARELGLVSRLARDATGSTPFAVTIGYRRAVPEVAVTSTLQGLALNLPAPLGKTVEAQLPLRYENALTRESLSPGARPTDQLTFELGRIASVNYIRDVSGDPRVLRGAIGVGLAAGESVPMPEQGVAANINLANFNVDTWEELLGPPASAGSASLRSAPAGSAASSYLPTVMAVRARELVLEGRSLHNVVVGGSRDGPTWRANVDGNELNGYLEYRQPVAAAGGRLFARLARLSIAAAQAQQVESLLEEQPSTLPALDIVVDDFELKGKKLGKLEIDAVNRGGPTREWRLNKLNLSMPEAQFAANGNWAALGAQAAAPARPGQKPPPERTRTAMKFRLDIADSGQLLARFGMKDVVRRGKGKLEGQVAWLGSPLALNYPSMDGVFNVNMESGQFLKADPGLAKLLGVVSLQSLPRRLTLDFRDVFSDGFAFDFVRGDVTIQDGIAATNNLQMKGVNAAVLMDGKADIARETQDIKVVVVPEINAGTASLVATVINPAIGLGSFLAQLVLREPLIRAATQEFQVDGTWADPRITRVGRREVRAESQKPGATN